MGEVVNLNYQEDMVANDHFAEEKAREWLIKLLKQGEVEVTFTKKDGTERVMDCSLEKTFIPSTEKKTERVRKDNPDVLSVVDIEIGQWRSFRWDSITGIKWGVPENVPTNNEE